VCARPEAPADHPDSEQLLRPQEGGDAENVSEVAVNSISRKTASCNREDSNQDTGTN